MTRRGASVSSSGSGAKPIDVGVREFIAYEIMQGILDATPMLFKLIKEGIVELLEERF